MEIESQKGWMNTGNDGWGDENDSGWGNNAWNQTSKKIIFGSKVLFKFLNR